MHKPSLSSQTVLKTSHPPGVRVGCDVIEENRIARAIQRRGQGFAELLFDSKELADHQKGSELSYETRFGLKESVLKAVGRGLSGSLNLGHVSTSGKQVELNGPVASLAGNVTVVHLASTSDAHVRTCVWLVPKGEDVK